MVRLSAQCAKSAKHWHAGYTDSENSIMKTKTRSVSLTLELDAQIERRVNSGRYGNASDVMRALRFRHSRTEVA